jgi:hypothetical protein
VSNKQLPLNFTPVARPSNTQPQLDNTTPASSESEELKVLKHRLAVLEEWVRMVEGHVTGPMAALPTLGEASLRVSVRR